jgi:murein DD-endopeptidase MepM/ murein hydrolase activator NlpD
LSLCLLGTVLALTTDQLEAFSSSPFPIATTPGFNEALAGRAPVREIATEAEAPLIPVELEIRRGETLSSLMQQHGLDAAETWEAVEALRGHLDIRRLRAGDRVAVLARPGRPPAAFRFEVADRGRVTLARTGGAWSSTFDPYVRTVETAVVSGTLEGSLDESVRRAGGTGALTYRMADVLQWDLDFNRDLRRGDRFEILYEQVYLDGRPHSTGNVLALVYDNAGRRHEVYRYGDGGFYTADGRPLEKMFLRSPLRYSRITSRFTHRRFHPVLKSYRPHYGVDYGAPIGTPVRVTAGGTVVSADWSRGGGRTVKVRHPNGYLTAYLHLSRFAKGIRAGARVTQGEVIAYTGNTGLSTGPHLDYRVQRNGRWIDPLSLKNVPAESIPTAQLDRFYAWRDACRQSLVTGEPLLDQLAPEGSGDEDVQLAHAGDAASALGLGTAGR